ncbi:MAG TPA: hypothetical protein VKV73_15265 [Chloroflexota bacterium]|nr:hypothetical protein [Chloroflexota bacterium]
MTQHEPNEDTSVEPEKLPLGELRPDDRGQDEVREALEESTGLGLARPLTRDEREAAERDPGVVETVYAPASERVAKPPLPADEKLINKHNQ